jgi:hypothetical protein
MEKMMTKGMALPELEAHSYAELLPDRIEMRRSKRVKKGNIKCDVRNVGGLVNNVPLNLQICQKLS